MYRQLLTCYCLIGHINNKKTVKWLLLSRFVLQELITSRKLLSYMHNILYLFICKIFYNYFIRSSSSRILRHFRFYTHDFSNHLTSNSGSIWAQSKWCISWTGVGNSSSVGVWAAGRLHRPLVMTLRPLQWFTRTGSAGPAFQGPVTDLPGPGFRWRAPNWGVREMEIV